MDTRRLDADAAARQEPLSQSRAHLAPQGSRSADGVLLEARYCKSEILGAYLNEIYLGQNGAVQIIGVEQASQVYFGKHVTYLTLPEAATLAGIIRSPNVLSPLKYPERAKPRRDTVLKLMLEQQKISEPEYQTTLAAPLSVTRFPRTSRSAPFFVDFVMRQLRETYPETQLKTEGCGSSRRSTRSCSARPSRRSTAASPTSPSSTRTSRLRRRRWKA